MMYKWEVLAVTAVIYARYSTDSQREESIEGQIRECTAYAEKNGFTVVKHYIDRAISAKTDNRPQFQQMIKDSERGIFDIIIVWKLDCFARNRYDSARYKTQLKRNGVKLVSATEVISAGPEGIIPESVLEGYAEYYSADLSEKVVRGMTENALKGKFSGGAIPFGYTINADRRFEIDPLTAPFVAETFQRYNDGQTMREIRDWLNEKGIKNKRGGPMSFNVIQHMLNNIEAHRPTALVFDTFFVQPIPNFSHGLTVVVPLEGFCYKRCGERVNFKAAVCIDSVAERDSTARELAFQGVFRHAAHDLFRQVSRVVFGVAFQH